MRTEALVAGVPPHAAWAWWTDFRPEGEDHAFAAWAHPRRTVEHLGPGRLRLREEARVLGVRFREEATLRLAYPVLAFRARNDLGAFEGTFRFEEAAGGGTRLVVEWQQELARPLRLLGPLGRWLVARSYAWDLRHHVRAMARELGGKPGS